MVGTRAGEGGAMDTGETAAQLYKMKMEKACASMGYIYTTEQRTQKRTRWQILCMFFTHTTLVKRLLLRH